MAYQRPGGEVGYILMTKNNSMKYIQPFCIITALVIALTYTGSASAAYTIPADTTTRNQLLIDALKDGETYNLQINSISCWGGGRFTMEITKRGRQFYMRLTDASLNKWIKEPMQVYGPVALDAAGLDSIRAMEKFFESPLTGEGHPACKGRSRYTFSVGNVQKEFVDDLCRLDYQRRLKRILLTIVTKPDTPWEY
jgi:hypothetical protein